MRNFSLKKCFVMAVDQVRQVMTGDSNNLISPARNQTPRDTEAPPESCDATPDEHDDGSPRDAEVPPDATRETTAIPDAMPCDATVPPDATRETTAIPDAMPCDAKVPPERQKKKSQSKVTQGKRSVPEPAKPGDKVKRSRFIYKLYSSPKQVLVTSPAPKSDLLLT